MGNPGSEAARHLREQSPLCFCFKPLIFLARICLSLCSEAWHSREAHVPSALLTVASSNMKRNYYHVFLSFRGTDVRQGFLSHLYAALDQQGIYTFVDSEELRKGEEISPTLARAIEESRIAIVVFSENYASSPWCLEELLKIMECKEQNGLIVFPVFYKVEPREVRGGRESYGRVMAKHESKFGKDSEKVKRWTKALLDAGSLSGWDFNDRNERDEAELIQSIVKELSICLRPRSLDVAKYPVNIESRVQKLISLSEPAGSDVLMIGLWGPGGIGKTTIAKALYNAIGWQFEGCSFLAQVREKSNQSGGHVDLQRQFLSEILPRKELMVYSVHGGISLIRERLCCKKVLLVLDDVDKMDQLNALAGKGDWFGKGSRIIVTSRDQHLLTSHGINCVYEVKTLEYDDALNLFSQHAFPNSNVEIRRDLIDRALHYANGLPLALEVLGLFLCGRNEAVWESALCKLSESPDQIINQVLKTSFDGLDTNEREIFLDIACFLKGKGIGYIQEVLDSCGFNTTIGIKILIERSLIKYENGSLQMHDLVLLMGKNIVKQECYDDPGKRSRLWLLEDVEDIFCYNMGTDTVKAIVLDLPPPKAIIINPDAFTNMKKLRILILHGVHISSQAEVRLPNELRYLKWSNAPHLEFGAGPKRLERLDIQKSHMRQLGANFQDFRKLKSINFSECKFLVSVPNLSFAPNLESLSLKGCKRLVEVHQSVGCLEKLKLLCLEGCSSLNIFPNALKTKSLHTLELSGCSSLEKFPDILGKVECLCYLGLRKTAIKELPASIENLVSVRKIRIRSCKNLARLPLSIYKLKNLKHLEIAECLNLAMFPKNMKDSTYPDGNLGFQNLKELDLSDCILSEVGFLESSSSFPKLKTLDLSNNKITHLPTCINKFNGLRDLTVDNCKQLQDIPVLPSNLLNLSARRCDSLQKLPDLSGHSSNELYVDFNLCSELLSKGINMADASLLEALPKMGKVSIVQSGREMPEWILHCQEESISFLIPQDLYDKFSGLALCAVLDTEEGKDGKKIILLINVQIFVNCQRVYDMARDIYETESNVMWFCYYPRSELIEVNEHLPNDWSHIQVFVRPLEGTIKNYGFRLICKQQEDDLRVVFPVPSADRNKLKFSRGDSEECNSTDTEEEGSPSETDKEESSSPLKEKIRRS